MLDLVVTLPPLRGMGVPIVPRRQSQAVAVDEYLHRMYACQIRYEHVAIIFDVVARSSGSEALAEQLGDNVYFGSRGEKEVCELNRIDFKVGFAEFYVTRHHFKVFIECQEVVPMNLICACLNHVLNPLL